MVFTAIQNSGSYSIRNEKGVEVMLSSESKEQIESSLKSQFNTDDIEIKWPDEQAPQKNKYFNEDNLKKAVGDDGIKQLQENTIDPGQSFLNGENTNLMYENNSSSSKKSDVNSNYKSNNIINSNQTTDLLTTGAAAVMALSGDDIASKGLAAKGQSFISNKVSSATASIVSSKTGQTLVNGTATALGTAVFGAQLVKNSPEILTTLAVQITSEAINVLSGEVAKLVGVYVGNHVNAITTWPAKVQSYAMAYFNTYKMSVGDVLKNLLEAAEDRSKKESEKNKESKMSKFISNMKTKMNSVTSDINEYVSIGTSYIQMVTSYIANGPDWVTDQIDKQLGNLCETAENAVNKQWEKDKNIYNESAKNTGDAIGAEMVERYNKTLQKSQEKMLKKIENNKKIALAKAAALLGKNKTKIASMTGIYIP